MELYQLQYFKILCEKKSVSAAAAAMHVSPPTITIAIQKLEKEFDIRLYNYENRSFVLTEIGQKFLVLSTSVLDAANSLELQIRSMKQSVTGELRVGCPRGQAFFTDHIYQFREQFPNVNVSIVQAPSRILVEHLSNNQLDFILISSLSMPDGVEFKPYAYMEWNAVIPKECGVFPGTTLDISQLEGFEIFVSPDDLNFFTLIEDYFLENNVHALTHHVNSPVPMLLKAHHLPKRMAFIPHSATTNLELLATYHLNPPLQEQLVLAWRKTKRKNNIQNAFINAAGEH